MDHMDRVSKLLEGRVILGQREIITEDLSIIPVYRLKISFVDLSTDLKNTAGDGAIGSVHITPLCLLQVKGNNLSVLRFEDKSPKEEFADVLPSLMVNIDLGNVLKGLKI